MQVGAKQLRTETASIIKQVQHGAEVTITYRGKAIGIIKPITKEAGTFKDIAFGLWAKRKDLKDVDAWLRQKRGPRFQK